MNKDSLASKKFFSARTNNEETKEAAFGIYFQPLASAHRRKLGAYEGCTHLITLPNRFTQITAATEVLHIPFFFVVVSPSFVRYDYPLYLFSLLFTACSSCPSAAPKS